MTQRQMGVRITKRREELNMTTTRLAELVGISQAQISRLENGRQGVRSAVLFRLSKALDVPPCYFVMGDKEWETYQDSAKKKR